MVKHLTHYCTTFIILFGVLYHNNQIYALAESDDQKFKNEYITGENALQQKEDGVTFLDIYKPPGLSDSMLSDLKDTGYSHLSNTLPIKDSKDFTLENLSKNSENSDDKNILKRCSERRFFKDSTSIKHPAVNKYKEKRKTTSYINFQKNKQNNLKDKKKSKKTKRTYEVNKKKRQQTEGTKLCDKNIGKKQKQNNVNDVYDNRICEDNSLDDSAQYFYDINAELDENSNDSQTVQEEKNSPKKLVTKQPGTFSRTKEKSRSRSHKSGNNFNKESTSQKHNKISHKNREKTSESYGKENLKKLFKKHNKMNSGSEILNDEQEDEEGLYSDWNLNRKNKIVNTLPKYTGKKKHFNKVNDNENDNKKALNVLIDWGNNLDTDFDNSTAVIKKGNGDNLANMEESQSNATGLEKSDDKILNEKFELYDYEDENVDSTGENLSENSSIDNASKNAKSDNFLVKVSKFPVLYKNVNNYNSSNKTNKEKLRHAKNKEPKDSRKTEVIQYFKNNRLHFPNKVVENEKSKSEKHLDKLSKQDLPKSKQLQGMKFDTEMLTKNTQSEIFHLKPLIDNVKRVYKVDPIAGHIEIQNITDNIKKRSNKYSNHEKNREFSNDQQCNFRSVSVDNSKDWLEQDGYPINNKWEIENSNMKNEFEPQVEVNDLYNDEERHPLLREQRQLGGKENKETFETKFKQGWESIKSKVMTRNENTSKENARSSSEPTDPSSTSVALIIDELSSEPCKNDKIDQQNKQHAHNNVYTSNTNTGTEQDVADINDFLTGKLSEKIVEEIFNRLHKSSKMIKDLGIGNQVQNVSIDKCISGEEDNELISLDKMTGSMANFNLLIAQDINLNTAKQCYAVPQEMESFLKYLFSVENKSPLQHYSDFPISDGSFIFGTNFIKNLCPGECKLMNMNNAMHVQEDKTERWDKTEQNRNIAIENENIMDNSDSKIQQQKTNINSPNELKNQPDNKEEKNEQNVFRNIEHEAPKSSEIKIPSIDNVPDAQKSDFDEEYMPEGIRRKKTLHYNPNQNYKHRNPFDAENDILDENEEGIKNKGADDVNSITVSNNIFLTKNGHEILNNENNIPKGINPELFDIEKVKKFKGKFDHILYSDTPHFDSSFNKQSDILKDEGKNPLDIAEDTELLDEDGFESAHMEKAPMEYYYV